MQITHAADIFLALAEPTRRNIVEILATRGQLSVSQISEKFRISPPAISQHLKVLRDTNILQVERQGQRRIYKINTDSLHELEDWAHTMNSLWSQRFASLDEVLELEKLKIKKG